MALAQFQPAQAPSGIVNSALAGFQTGQSFFERQYQMRLAQDRGDLERQHYDVALPLIVAKTRADAAQVTAELRGLEQTEDSRRQAYELLPKARAEFDGIMALTDPKGRAEAAVNWASRYGHLENVGPIGAEFKSKNALARRLVDDGVALSTLRETLASRERIAAIGANSRELTGLPTFEKLRRLRDQATEEGDTVGAQELDAMLTRMQRTPTPATDASRIKALLSEADDAEAAGDTTLAAALRSRVRKLTEPRQDDAGLLRQEVLGLLGGKTATPSTNTPAPKTTTPAQQPATGNVDDAINSLKF